MLLNAFFYKNYANGTGTDTGTGTISAKNPLEGAVALDFRTLFLFMNQ